jgi:hypothetical protein
VLLLSLHPHVDSAETAGSTLAYRRDLVAIAWQHRGGEFLLMAVRHVVSAEWAIVAVVLSSVQDLP